MKTDFAIAPVWLKDVGQIDALMGVYYLALLAEALLERELRQAMEREGLESLPMYPEGRACRCPTARRLIDIFDPIQRHEIHQPCKTPIIMVTELTPLQRRLLRLLRIPLVESCEPTLSKGDRNGRFVQSLCRENLAKYALDCTRCANYAFISR